MASAVKPSRSSSRRRRRRGAGVSTRKLGSILQRHLAAGVVIGPSGLGFFTDPASVLHVAELGVVLFLFIIGLRDEPLAQWSMRRDIFNFAALGDP